MRAELIDESRSRVGRRKWIVRQKVLGDRIEAVLGNDIARKRVRGPRPVAKLVNGGRIVNCVSHLPAGRIEEIEVAVQHLGTGHVADEGLRGLLVMAGKSE